MSESINPYTDWLHITVQGRAPNHYELLGLAPLENDPEVIRNQYWDRFELVRRYEVGAYTEPALKLLEEISQAFQCLTNPQAKAAYDAQLRREAGLTETLAGEALRDTRSDAPAPALVAKPAGTVVVAATPVDAKPAAPAKAAAITASPGTDNFVKSDVKPNVEVAPADGAFQKLWKEKPSLVIGGGLGTAGVLLFCAALLLVAGGSEDDRARAAATEDAAASSDDSGVADENPLYEWTGSLTRVVAITGDAPQPSVADEGEAGVYLLIDVASSTDPDKPRRIAAVTPDPIFLRELADFFSEQDAADETEPVVVRGRPTGELLANRRVYANDHIPKMELVSIRKQSGSSLATVGQRRDLGDFAMSLEAIELASALRTLDGSAHFEARVVDRLKSGPVVAAPILLNRQLLLSIDPDSSTVDSRQLLPGHRIQVEAQVTGQATFIDAGSSGVAGEIGVFQVTKLEVLQDAPPLATETSPAPTTTSASESSSLEPPETAPLHVLQGSGSAPLAMAWSPTGEQLATAAADGEIAVWNPIAGERQFELSHSHGMGAPWSLQWSNDGQWLLAYRGDQAGVWNVDAESESSLNSGLHDLISRPSWSQVRGQLMLIGLRGNDIFLADPSSATSPSVVRLNASLRPGAFCFSSSGVWAATSYSNLAATPVEYGVVLQPFAMFLMSAAGARSAVGSASVSTPEQVREVQLRDGVGGAPVWLMAQLDRQLMVFTWDGGRDEQPTQVAVVDHGYRIADATLSWSRDGQRLALAADEVQLHDLTGRVPEEPKTLPIAGKPNTVAFAPDGKHLAIGGVGKGLVVWDCEKDREVLSWKPPMRVSSVRLLEWRPDAQQLAALHSDGTLTIWDTTAVPEVKAAPAAPFAGAVGGFGGGFVNPLGQPFAGGGFGQPHGQAAEQTDQVSEGEELLEANNAAPRTVGGQNSTNFEAALNEVVASAANRDWDDFHAQVKALEEATLKPQERVALGKVKGNVLRAAKQMLANVANAKQSLGKSNPAQYQAILQQIIAMVPNSNWSDRATKLLEENIEEFGEQEFSGGFNNPRGRRR